MRPIERRALLTAALLGTLLGGCARQRPPEPLYPQPAPAALDWEQALTTQLAPLRHARGDRWPLVLWRGVGFEPLAAPRIEALLARGIVPHLRLREADVEAARALTAAGAPVILMEGAGGAWPYDSVDGITPWRLRFPPDAAPPPAWRALPDPTRLAGWRRARDLTRHRLQRYAAAGVVVDAVWLDYEGALLHDDYQALRASTAAARLPQDVLDDEWAYRRYRRIHWLHRLSRYLAAPVRRVFPDAAVTNWVVMVSSTAYPLLSWTDWPHPSTPPLFFTHSNPIAYGVDSYFLSAWPPALPVNRPNVDRFYTHLLLRQVSMDALNRSRYRPGMGAVVWVARWVPEHPQRRVPVMSRRAYREALRHIWLRGADAMQVFNPPRPGFEQLAVDEVQDVQRVYDEMLAYRSFLEDGEILNFNVPHKSDALMMWSGLRLADRALVRVTNLGARQSRVYLCVTHDACFDLPMPRHGRSFMLDLAS